MIFISSLQSCKKFLDTDISNSEIDQVQAFDNEATADAISLGLFQAMRESAIAGNKAPNISWLGSLSADDMNNYYQTPELAVFEQADLLPNTTLVQQIWREAYQIIYQANNLVESAAISDKLIPAFKNRMTGEALFARAYCHFYLVNLFGDVPVVITSDYKGNAVIARQPTVKVYGQITDDLVQAMSLVPDNYVGTNRIRPNKQAVAALLSRVYLFTEKWPEAVAAADEVIESGTYSLPPSLSDVFLTSSSETIWQLAVEKGLNSGDYLLLTYNTLGSYDLVLRQELLDAFESNDLRKTSWVQEYADVAPAPVSVIAKYRHVSDFTNPSPEFLVILRLAEVWLTRAEAHARLGNLPEAIADLDQVRHRAGITLIADTNPGIQQEALINLIIHERRVELFGERALRWLDLKRLGLTQSVLAPIKGNWSENDRLYPIPQDEFGKNPFLGDQNAGY